MNHLFINYATEDQALARWLARKLAARGHPVWFDQIKMLGGEPWPQEIDDAIKNRTFRMLALISKHSLQKPKPTGERTLAQRIAEQRNIPDFLIPLKLDGSELDWLTSPLSYISFTNGWADGWRSIIKKLDSISTPRSLLNASPLAASSFPRGEDLIGDFGEPLFANVIRVKSFPTALQMFRLTTNLEYKVKKQLENSWAFYEIQKDHLVALTAPPQEFIDRVKSTGQQWLWTASDYIQKIPTRHVAATLMMKSLSRRLIRSGCRRHPNPKRQNTFYLSNSFTKDEKLHFTGYKGKKTWLLIRGRTTFRRGEIRETNFHHFGFRLQLARGLGREFFVQLTPSLVFFDQDGNAITDKSAGARRRRLTKTWWNHKWLNRLMAAEQILTSLAPAEERDLMLEPGLISLSSPKNLIESVLQTASKDDGKEEKEELELEIGTEEVEDE